MKKSKHIQPPPKSNTPPSASQRNLFQPPAKQASAFASAFANQPTTFQPSVKHDFSSNQMSVTGNQMHEEIKPKTLFAKYY